MSNGEFKINIKDSDIQKIIDVEYGLSKEYPIKKVLENVFNMKLNKSSFNFSSFDFYDTNYRFLFELKCYRYSYDTYNTEIIGVNKGLTNNSVFIFQHENIDLYFIQYDSNLFNTFIKENVFYRGKYNLCYRIPKQYLTKIDVNSVYELKHNMPDYEITKQYIYNDKLNFDKISKK
jgi:hypothetical protein